MNQPLSCKSGRWRDGIDETGRRPAARHRSGDSVPGCSYVLITGGAGFIGTNLADHLASRGEEVLLLDNLSRSGVEQNVTFLQRKHGTRVRLLAADVRDGDEVRRAVAGATSIFHLAAQVAVTTSLVEPRRDCETNLLGTLNVLEAVRACSNPPPVLFTSTNKVYGQLNGLKLRKGRSRYEPLDGHIARSGVGEGFPLDFHSPYGCSKGAADQYVLDYARCFGLPAVVFRMSCIYGRHQMGNEDQGWVAHFLMRALAKQPITVYGDGLQVRDLLFADDLVEAMVLARAAAAELKGQAFNIGGGPRQSASLEEIMATIEELFDLELVIDRGPWRVGDQRYYVSDTTRFYEATGWLQKCGLREGLIELGGWIRGSRQRAATGASPLQPAVTEGLSAAKGVA